VRGVTYVDDSKGTNVGATLAAVAGLPGPLIVIAGGEGKNQDFTPLAAAFRGKVRHTVLIGRDAPQLARALSGACTLETCATLREAVQAAARAARPGDTVLLSPACASLDMFRDYTHRGAVFAAAVQELAA
jgi:UDP-N-acetylmuramoylalanine--D-glutamate ligase